MKLYTIGFTKKTASEFFMLLMRNEVIKIIDIRLNNKSQLAGFAKGGDLKYFLNEIGNIGYVHMLEYAPTKGLLDSYRKKTIDWKEYDIAYKKILKQREIIKDIDYSIFNDACLLCSEETPQNCHRRLLAEYLTEHNKEIQIIHL